MKVLLPTPEFYSEMTQRLAQSPCIMELDEIIGLAISKHFQGQHLDLHNNVLFQTYSSGVERDIAVGVAEFAVELVAAELQPLLINAGIDPRHIVNVGFIRRDLIVEMEESDGNHSVTEGITRCIVPNHGWRPQ